MLNLPGTGTPCISRNYHAVAPGNLREIGRKNAISYYEYTFPCQQYPSHKYRAYSHSYLTTLSLANTASLTIMPASMEYVIFSDLDGTLLDEGYSFSGASKALLELKKHEIPVVLCTSKTRAETLFWREQLGLNTPFIVENGGAILIPHNYFPATYPDAKQDFTTITLGASYERLRLALTHLQLQGIKLKGFGDMSVSEVASLTGLNFHLAFLAKQRQYDEPFIFEGKQSEGITHATTLARQQGLRVEKGGRFYHLLGNNDKGEAVLILKKLYQQQYSNITLVGIGDSENDLSLLSKVYLPFLVQRPNKTYASPDYIHAPGIGPRGWSWVVKQLLDADQAGFPRAPEFG